MVLMVTRIHSTCIMEEDDNNDLDVLATGIIEWRTGIGFRGVFDFGAGDDLCVLMWGELYYLS